MLKNGQKRVSILVVEDEPVIRQVCRRALETDYDVTLTPDGHAATELLQSATFDICLIDIRTPRMNGEELFRWIETNRPEMVPGVIFTTGDVISNNTDQFLAGTKRPYLPKPFSPAELAGIVEKVVLSLP